MWEARGYHLTQAGLDTLWFQQPSSPELGRIGKKKKVKDFYARTYFITTYVCMVIYLFKSNFLQVLTYTMYAINV